MKNFQTNTIKHARNILMTSTIAALLSPATWAIAVDYNIKKIKQLVPITAIKKVGIYRQKSAFKPIFPIKK